MPDKKVSERDFVDENMVMEGPIPQVIVTSGADIPQNGQHLKRTGNQTYWSLVKHKFKKNACCCCPVLLCSCSACTVADFLANDKPLYCTYKGESYFPVFKQYSVNWVF
jgi:hypothetical protein